MGDYHFQSGNYRSQVVWQIYVPLLIFSGLIFLGGYYLFSNLSAAVMEYGIWLDISVLVIFSPLLLIGLILFILLLIKIILLAKIQGLIKVFFLKVSPLVRRILEMILKVIQLTSKPFIAIESTSSIFDFTKTGEIRK